MKIYRVHYYDDEDGSTGFSFHTTRKEAYEKMRSWISDHPESREILIDEYHIPLTKKDVLAALDKLATHPKNG